MDSPQADNQFFKQVVSPYREMAAYEALWEKSSAPYKRIADMFKERPGAIPSDLVEPEAVEEKTFQGPEFPSSKKKVLGLL